MIQKVISNTCSKKQAFKICLEIFIGVALPIILTLGITLGGFFILQRTVSLYKWKYLIKFLLIVFAGISLLIASTIFLGIFIKNFNKMRINKKQLSNSVKKKSKINSYFKDTYTIEKLRKRAEHFS